MGVKTEHLNEHGIYWNLQVELGKTDDIKNDDGGCNKDCPAAETKTTNSMPTFPGHHQGIQKLEVTDLLEKVKRSRIWTTTSEP